MIHEFRERTIKFCQDKQTVNYTEFIGELKKIKDEIALEKKLQKLEAAKAFMKKFDENELREFVEKLHKCDESCELECDNAIAQCYGLDTDSVEKEDAHRNLAEKLIEYNPNYKWNTKNIDSSWSSATKKAECGCPDDSDSDHDP